MALSFETPSRILVIRFSSMGDIVLTSPVTRQLSRICPDAEIDFLTREEYASLARALPGIVQVQRFEPERGLWALVARLRRRRYDLVIDLHGSIRSRLVRLAGNARRAVRYDKRRIARMALVARSGGSVTVPHTVDRYLEVLEAFDGKTVCDETPSDGAPDASISKLPELIVEDSAEAEVASRLADGGIGPEDPVLGLAPGASHRPKRWPPDRFARVADHLAAVHGMSVLLLGSEEDRPVAAEVAGAMEEPALDWTGETDLALLPAAVKRCRHLVCNDSGPMHVATAVGTPVTGVFGATHPRLGFAPLGPEDAAVSLDLPCSPCSLHGNRACRFGTHACMEDLPSQSVIAEAKRRLSA